MTPYVIHEHTFDIEPLRQPGATVLDVGCLDFVLTRSLLDTGCFVCGVDPSPKLANVPSHDKFVLVQKALVSRANAIKKAAMLHVPTDLYGAYVETGSNPVQTQPQDSYPIALIDLPTLMWDVNVRYWTAIKLDCEGSEYELLLDWPGPIAGQISVEFHDHLIRGMDITDVYQAILKHLSRWYTPYKFERTPKQYAGNDLGLNYWDTLFLLK